MNKKHRLCRPAETTERLNMALNLLKNTTPPAGKMKQYKQAVEALEGIKEWAAGAVAKIKALQEEVDEYNQLLIQAEVGGTHSPI